MAQVATEHAVREQKAKKRGGAEKGKKKGGEKEWKGVGTRAGRDYGIWFD